MRYVVPWASRGSRFLGNISFVAAYGRPEGSPLNIKLLATKGGSLGEEDTLEKILNFVDTQAYQ